MTKKVVRYKPSYYTVAVGSPTLVYPIDHPSPDVTNDGVLAITSPVVSLHDDGFETENTRYVIDVPLITMDIKRSGPYERQD